MENISAGCGKKKMENIFISTKSKELPCKNIQCTNAMLIITHTKKR